MTFSPTDPIALAQALIRCPSVTPAEAGALSLIARVLGEAGFVCHRMTFSEHGTPDVENLYARLGSRGPNLCFAGHTDVVPPGPLETWRFAPFEGAIVDDVLYGRGAVDMKGAIACFIAAALQRIESGAPLAGSISLLITGDEEGPSINGTAKVLNWLAARSETLDAAIVGEPSNPSALGDEIKIGRRGSLTGRLTVHGTQGHAAYPQLADNPLPKLVRMLEGLSRLHLDAGSADFEPSNLQLTVIGTPNQSSNVIPGEATATFNVRYNDHWRRASIEAHLRTVIAQLAAESGARITIAFAGTGDVFLTRPGPLVDTMRSSIEAVLGRTPALTTGGGTSDARFIQAHCPVIEFGLVNRTIHQVDEHVPLDDLRRLTAVYRHVIDAYFAAAE